MEPKEYEARITELTKELDAAKARIATLEAPPAPPTAAPDNKELETAKAQVIALEARVKELENKPNPKTPGATAAPAEGEPKELEAPKNRVVVSRTGEVFGA